MEWEARSRKGIVCCGMLLCYNKTLPRNVPSAQIIIVMSTCTVIFMLLLQAMMKKKKKDNKIE
jgi:hypothetical protein